MQDVRIINARVDSLIAGREHMRATFNFEERIGDVTDIAHNLLNRLESERPLTERIWSKIEDQLESISKFFIELWRRIKQFFRGII